MRALNQKTGSSGGRNRLRRPSARVAQHGTGRRKPRAGAKDRKNIIAAGVLCGLALAVIVSAAGFFIQNGGRTRDAEALAVTYNTLAPEVTVSVTAEPTAQPTPEPTPEITAEPTAQPTPFAYLPVVYKGNTDARRIAITVDDCFQTENLEELVQLAVDNGGRLTLFPIGENIRHEGMVALLQKCVYQLGFEIENHTWSHQRIFRLSEEEMAAEIWKQSRAVSLALKADYHQHFLRLMGGDGVSDQRTHNYLDQLGYLGIAGWSYSGSDAPLEDIQSTLAPGMIYLFHTTDADTEKLRAFIPWVKEQGYEMVTLNALLGLQENGMTGLTDDPMPEPRDYAPDYRTHRQGDYAWVVVQMQDKLRAMGYLKMDGPSTGYYGGQTAEAVAAFQKAQGILVTGEADEATQRAILGS